jgi:predicted membrane protein DUF2207
VGSLSASYAPSRGLSADSGPRLQLAQLGLSSIEIVLLVAALATGGAWLLAATVVFLVRRPPEPPEGPRTLDLGPEPPAVANFLVSDFRVTDAAVPSTLIDLAARNVVDVEQRGPGVFYVRLRAAGDESLTAYEDRVLDHLRRKASDGVVPAEALTTGTAEESKRWRRAFGSEVVEDAKARGLSRDALDSRALTVLTAAAAVPALLVWPLWDFEPAAGVMIAAVALLGWIRARHPQRETPAGMDAASRWLGVRAELAENPVFETHSPLTVEIWNRLLAYGAALGVASGASAPLPMGTESDRHAWSAYSGRWRPVEVRYRRPWLFGSGRTPLNVLARGVGMSLVGGFFLYVLGPTATDGVSSGEDALFAGAILLIPSVLLIAGIAYVVLGLSDLGSTREVTGPILRLRRYGDDESPRYYVAVDDGISSRIRAWEVSPALYTGLEQGELVTVRLTKKLGCVRSIVPAGTTPAPPAPSPTG